MKKIPTVHKKLAAVLLFVLLVGCFLTGVLYISGKKQPKNLYIKMERSNTIFSIITRKKSDGW